MHSIEATTPFHEASLRDKNIFYKGMPVQWDEDHFYPYFIPNDLASTKYKHLVENATITEWDEYE